MKEAKIFTRWVTSEVIPSIRKKGEYKLENKITEKLSIEFEQKLRINNVQKLYRNVILEYKFI